MEANPATMETAQRRLRMVNAHLQLKASEEPLQLESQPTAGEYIIEEGYSVLLPEKLSTGKWNVHR
jgi:long-chain acyl-CoA synthetase